MRSELHCKKEIADLEWHLGHGKVLPLAIDDDVVDALRRAVAAVAAHEPRPIPVEVLAPLIKVAQPGQIVDIDIAASRVIGAPLITVTRPPDVDAMLSPLTARQKQVALLVIDGLPNRVIADRLSISLATVKDHVHAILSRLRLPSRTALISATRQDRK